MPRPDFIQAPTASPLSIVEMIRARDASGNFVLSAEQAEVTVRLFESIAAAKAECEFMNRARARFPHLDGASK